MNGGTAAFGATALSLALVSTALNFLYVPREEEYLWLPGLMWSVVLWQSFMGWWWWVGAGSSSGSDGKVPVEEIILREEKRGRRRRAQLERRKETTERAKRAWRGVTGVISKSKTERHQQRRRVPRPEPPSRTQTLSEGEAEEWPPTSSTGSAASNDVHSHLLPRAIYQWCNTLRNAHQAAARVQTVERAERIREMERDGVLSAPRDPSVLGSFGRRIGLSGTSGKRFERNKDIILPIELEEYGRDRGRIREGDSRVGSSRAVGQSIAWWGPLRRWRLQNQTVYPPS
jgi:hypothetical protein